jgi:hypothetical protein
MTSARPSGVPGRATHRGVRIPVWLALAVAAFVVIFGVYRIRLGLIQSPEDEAAAKKRGGLYGMGKRFHLFIGTIYILMGAALTAMAFGWQPLAGGTPADTPAAQDTATPIAPTPPPPQK